MRHVCGGEKGPRAESNAIEISVGEGERPRRKTREVKPKKPKKPLGKKSVTVTW